MSTSFIRVAKKAVMFLTLGASLCVGGLCVLVVSADMSVGKDVKEKAASEIENIANSSFMTPFCKAVGVGLISAAVTSKNRVFALSERYWVAKENAAAETWDKGGCPLSALPSIAVAASRISLERELGRPLASADDAQ